MKEFIFVYVFTFALLLLDVDAFTPKQHLSIPLKRGYVKALYSSHEDIEAYVGPISSLGDMEGGIAVGELSLSVLVGPSQVASGRGLYLSIYEDIDDEDEESVVEEIIIPQGTPLCGYARGFFSDDQDGDKSVGFLFGENTSADTVAVFFNQQLMTLGDAIWDVYSEKQDTENFLFGHFVEVDSENGEVTIRPDTEFQSRIFIPDDPTDETKFAATSLGVFANDLAFDPSSSEEEYFDNSERNNILQLVWRLARDEKTGGLVPTWPVVIARKDVRLVNTVPMEVGLQYGYGYWEAVQKEGTSKYISD
ncbi:hypothetical protein CTEN210_15720 [Chaetoceros tenuissimus]|uniref:Carbohydrate-binding domain-containing protein n=1 Tax=Chaetoceros tenuissimus TaxID=426638 RepID=A0AAD3D7H0_9STRA|nr:hypothetical protein CTEN210_15720 [Chaetoceros tenuissimus]